MYQGRGKWVDNRGYIMKLLAPVAVIVLGFMLVRGPTPVTKAGAGGPQPTPPSVLGPALTETSPAPQFTPAVFTTTCGSSRTTSTAAEQMVLTLTNQLRAQNGLGALALSSGDLRSADTHSLQMAQSGTFAHDSYPNTLARTTACGSSATVIAENIAGNGSGDPNSTFQQYVNSPEHKANLLAPAMHFVGISFEQGIYNDGTTTWQGFFMNTMTFSDQDGGGVNPGPQPTPTPAPSVPLTATITGPTQAQVGQAVTLTVGGTGSSVPWYAVNYGDGQSANWQQTPQFTHVYQAAGQYGPIGYLGDGTTGITSTGAQMFITVSQSPSSPTPQPTQPPGSALCQVLRNGQSLAQFPCP
jgi:uncharacterized protein YkwD